VSRCRSIWAVFRIDDDVAPGTVLVNSVEITSSDDVTYPTNDSSTPTTAGSLAIRDGVVRLGKPGRDSIRVHADLARSGLRTALDPPSPDIDATGGVHVTFGEPGGTPMFDADVPAAALRCRGRVCRLHDAADFGVVGLDKLEIQRHPELRQRNNATVRARARKLSLTTPVGTELELHLEAAGVTYVGQATYRSSSLGKLLRFGREQGKLP
jgi:hypothetical protein